MSICPLCGANLGDDSGRSGNCPVCGSVLAWTDDSAPHDPAPLLDDASVRDTANDPPPIQEPGKELVSALRATLSAIARRGVERPGYETPTVIPSLLPDSSNQSGRTIALPDRDSVGPGSGNIGAGDSGPAKLTDSDSPPPKKPSTFDNRKIAATLDRVPGSDTDRMSGLWQQSVSNDDNPRMTIKTMGPSSPKDSRLVIKSRALRDTNLGETSPGAEYELLSLIGEGGMGVVYAARQASIDRTVALKMLKADISFDQEQREKFLSEAVVTGDLDHPNIVPIYDLGTNEAGALFYSMKRVQGTPWIDVMAKKSLPENLEILLKVADAVAFAHSRGIVHRDLKPENVMLGEFGEVLVMDWGLALSTENFRKSGSITQSGSMGGTPAYMAPEMATGPVELVGPPSDVYLLGAILFEIITGLAPHTGKNVMNCLFAAARNVIQPTKHSGELLDIAMKAMSTSIDDRHPSVRDFQAAVRLYQSHSESIVLSTRAESDLEEAQKTGDYQIFSRAMFAFQEALALWSENTRARSKLSLAKLAYAQAAATKEDFDLAASLLDADDPAHVELKKKVTSAQRERQIRQQRLRHIKILAAACVLLMLGVSTVAYYITNQKSQQLELANITTTNALTTAKQMSQDLLLANGMKEKSLIEVEQKRREAVAATAEAVKAKNAAVAATELALKATKSEEYESYVARIGVAAAKIDENSFDTAVDLLNRCKPELRGWEWGRLMHLCAQRVPTFDSGEAVESVAFDASGKHFVTGSWDGEARLWDVATSKAKPFKYGAAYVQAVALSHEPEPRHLAMAGSHAGEFVKIVDLQTGDMRSLVGHEQAVLSVQFSADNRTLLTSSYDKTARLWDVATGKQLKLFQGHSWWVWSAAFSPTDRNKIVTAGQDGTAIVWSIDSAQKYRTFTGHKGPVYSAVFSPDGRRVASGGYDARVLVWDPEKLKDFDFERAIKGQQNSKPPFAALDGHTAAVRSVAFSPQGNRIVSGGHDNTVKVWDVASGRAVKTLRGHASWVRSCCFSPDGKHVLSGSFDQRAKLWDIGAYEEVRVLQSIVLQGHTDAVLAANFSPDGNTIVTASRDRTAKTWDFKTGQRLKSFEEGHEYLASTAVFFPDGKRLLTAAVDNSARIWDVETGVEIQSLTPTGRSAAAAISNDGRLVVTGADHKTARIWDLASGEFVTLRDADPSLRPSEVTAVAFSPDDALVFTGDSFGVGRLWNAKSGVLVHRLVGHTGDLTAGVFLPNGQRILTASSDMTVGQWDVATGQELRPLTLKHPEAVTSLVITLDGHRAITSCLDQIVRVWDIDRPVVLGPLGSDGSSVNSIAISRDGHLAMTASTQQRNVRLWDLETRQQINAPDVQGANSPFLDLNVPGGAVWSVTFAPAGNHLLTVGGNEARLWEIGTAREAMRFSPQSAVASASFSPDGQRIATASWDNSAKIWNAATGKAERKLFGEMPGAEEAKDLLGHAGYVNSAVFSPDSTRVLTASDDGTAKIWDAAVGKVLLTIRGHEGRVRSATYSADGKLILTSSSDKTARLWDSETGEPRGVFNGHSRGLLAASFSADGQKVITGSDDNTARIWRTSDQTELLVLAGHTASIGAVAFSPDPSVGGRVLTGSKDNTVKLWDATTGKEILTLKGHTQEVTSAEFSPNGKYALTASRDGTAIVWLTTDAE